MSHSLSQIFHDSGRESVAGVNSNTMNPFLRFTSKVFSLPTWAKLIIRTGISPPSREEKLPASDRQPAQSQSFESIGSTVSSPCPLGPNIRTGISPPLREEKLLASDRQPAQGHSFGSIGSTANDNSVTVTVYSPDAYLHYSPLPSNRDVSYIHCLCKLGFKPEEAELGVDNRLIKDLRAYLEGTEYFYLRECDNPTAFKTLVLDFLEATGPRYWGHSKRRRLEEKEPSKGFLYPRDIQRGKTAFLDAIENLFNYKAASNYRYDMRKPPEKQMHKYIDFAAMTGRRVDAKALADTRNLARSISNNKTSPGPSVNFKDERPKRCQTVTSESEDDDDRAWNVFDQVETETVLRPNPVRTKWTRELPDRTEALDNHLQCHEKPVRPNKHSQRRGSSVDHGTSQKRRKTQSLNTGTHKKLSIDSSTDSDVPLLHKAAKKHRPSPPTTRDQSLATVQTAFTAPGIFSRPSIISLVSDSDEERTQTIKNEPLSASARAATLLKVSMHNQPEKLEISVPLGACRTSNQLFDKLTTEWRLRPEMANKVNFISARYRWSGEPHGMRRGEPLDWELFCTTIREAWDKKEGDVKDKCIVEMKLIADD